MKLNENTRYLFKFIDFKPQLHEITILKLTEKSIYYKFHRSDGTTYNEWDIREEFENKYVIHEIIENTYNIDSLRSNYTPKLICPICNGNKSIPDPNSDNTSKTKKCPFCS